MRSFLLIVSHLVCFLVGALIVHGGRTPTEKIETIRVDTLVIRDTMRYTEVKPYKVKVTDTLLVPASDTVTLRDTLWLQLPKETKTYKDSTYEAVVSGYKPELESITVYPTTAIIHTTTQLPPNRWGWTVTAGPTIAYDGKPRVGLGLTIGLGCRIQRGQ